MVNTQVTLCGISLENPVIPASGTFGFGQEFAALYDINCLGSFSFKGTTLNPRFGNPLPRIAECPSGMLNAVGLQNPGVKHVKEVELPALSKIFHKPVMANVSGFSVSEYVSVVEQLSDVEQIGWFEVNISCPNVHGGGMSFGTCPDAAAEVTRAVRAVTKKPSSSSSPPTSPTLHPLPAPARTPAPTASASSIPCSACAWICARESPFWPIPPAATQARRYFPWRYGWSTRSMTR